MFNIFQFDNPCWTTSQPPTKAGKWIQKIERLVFSVGQLVFWLWDRTLSIPSPPLWSPLQPSSSPLSSGQSFRQWAVLSGEEWGQNTVETWRDITFLVTAKYEVTVISTYNIYSNTEYKYVNPCHSNSQPAVMSWCGEEWWGASVDCGVQWTDRNLCCVNLMFSNNLLPHTLWPEPRRICLGFLCLLYFSDDICFVLSMFLINYSKH